MVQLRNSNVHVVDPALTASGVGGKDRVGSLRVGFVRARVRSNLCPWAGISCGLR